MNNNKKNHEKSRKFSKAPTGPPVARFGRGLDCCLHIELSINPVPSFIPDSISENHPNVSDFCENLQTFADTLAKKSVYCKGVTFSFTVFRGAEMRSSFLFKIYFTTDLNDTIIEFI